MAERSTVWVRVRRDMTGKLAVWVRVERHDRYDDVMNQGTGVRQVVLDKPGARAWGEGNGLGFSLHERQEC